MEKLIFATTNINKIKEAEEILGIKVEGLKLNIDEVQTLDPLEAVEKKAQQAFQQTNKPVLVEDTSLFFNAWNGLPGVFIDAFMDSAGNEGLLKMLGDQTNRKAKAVVYLAIFDGQKFKTYKGEVDGIIALEPRGQSGFGWDPIFIPIGFNKTFAEMDMSEKSRISMRKLAFEELKKDIK